MGATLPLQNVCKWVINLSTLSTTFSGHSQASTAKCSATAGWTMDQIGAYLWLSCVFVHTLCVLRKQRSDNANGSTRLCLHSTSSSICRVDTACATTSVRVCSAMQNLREAIVGYRGRLMHEGNEVKRNALLQVWTTRQPASVLVLCILVWYGRGLVSCAHGAFLASHKHSLLVFGVL